MKRLSFVSILLFVISCGDPEHKEDSVSTNTDTNAETNMLEIERIDYESKVDSVNYQSLFKWDKNWIGIAEFYNEEKDVNLFSLQLLEMNKDSSLTLISQTERSFDGLVFYPTFFRVSERVFILANTGAMESWGNKIFELKGTEFINMGFIDAASVEPNQDDDEQEYYHRNIAKNATFTLQDKSIKINFQGDSIVLFDDQKGAYDLILGPEQLEYTLSGDQFTLQTNY